MNEDFSPDQDQEASGGLSHEQAVLRWLSEAAGVLISVAMGLSSLEAELRASQDEGGDNTVDSPSELP